MLEDKAVDLAGSKLPEYFPVPFRLKQQLPHGNSYFREVLAELEKDSLLKQLLSQEQLGIAEDLLLKEKEYNFLFYDDFLSVLVFRKKRSFTRTTLALLFLCLSKTKVMTNSSEVIEYIDSSKDNGIFHLGEIDPQFQKEDVNEQVRQMKMKIDEELKLLSYDPTKPKEFQEKSPSLLKKLAQKITKAKKQGQKQEPVKMNEAGSPNHKFTVVPNKAHQFCQAIITYLTQDQDTARVIMFGFRMAKLSQNIRSLKSFQRELIGKIKECLQELYLEYKGLYNSRLDINLKKIEEFFLTCQGQLQTITSQGLGTTPKKITKEELNTSIVAQLKDCKPLEIKAVLNFKKFRTNPIINPTNIGFIQNNRPEIQDLFTDLIQLLPKLQRTSYGVCHWLTIVEYVLQLIAKNLQEEEFIMGFNFNQFCCNEGKISPLHVLINRYVDTTICGHSSCAIGQLPEQNYCHAYLARMIGAALAFQRYRLEMARPRFAGFAVEEYHVGINQDLKCLFENFTSLSYSMKQAFHYLLIYSVQNGQKYGFFQIGEPPTFQNYLLRYFKNDPKSQSAWRTLKDKLDRQRKALRDSFDSFRERYNQAVATKIQLDLDEESYQEQLMKKKKPYETYYKNLSPNYYKIKEIEKLINNLKGQTFDYILTSLPKMEKDQHIMVTFMTSLLQGLFSGTVKMIMQTQVPINNKIPRSGNIYNNKGNYDKIQSSPLYYLFQSNSPQKGKLIDEYEEPPELFVKYNYKHRLQYYTYSKISYINDNHFKTPTRYTQNNPLGWMFSKPILENKIRQHQIYSSLREKQQLQAWPQLQKMPIDQYYEIASIKVAPKTQIPILCQGILSRDIKIDTLQSHQLLRYIILSTVGDLNACRSLFENKGRLTYEDIPKNIIKESILQMLEKYPKSWRYQDFFSLQVIGVAISLLGKQIGQPKMVADIACFAFQEYLKLKKELKNDKSHGTKLRLLRLVNSIMSLFWEDICEDNSKACKIFAQIMVESKIHMRYINSPLATRKDIKGAINDYFEYFHRAKHMNINSVVDYFKDNTQEITEVISLIDEGIGFYTEWQFKEDKNYVFQSVAYLQTYEVNFFQGLVLKNNSESSSLPPEIQKNKFVVSIFGDNTDLLVFRMTNGGYRTRQSYEDKFSNEVETKVFFQFHQLVGMVQDPLRMKMIMKTEQKEVSYLFIPPETLQELSIFIPQKYQQSYFCWLQESSNHLIFRKKSIEEMKEVGLVFLSQEIKEGEARSPYIYEGRIITVQFKNKPLRELLDHRKSILFEKILVIHKEKRINKAIEVLGTVELPQFIVQTYPSGPSTETQFWLIRNNIKFNFSPLSGLTSLNYEGYSVNEEYCHHKLLPWSQLDEVKCLVLTKIENGLKSCMHHQHIVLIPHQAIGKNGKIVLPVSQNSSNQLFRYDLHDNFQDLRSRSRLQQLQLAAMVCSFPGGFPCTPLKLTNEEYAVSLLRACYSNIEMDKSEGSRFMNIVNLCIELNLNILLLCCQVLLQSTSIVKNIQQTSQSSRIQLTASTENLIQACCTVYHQRSSSNLVTSPSKLSEMELNFLGVDNELGKLQNRMRNREPWEKEQSAKIKLEEKQIKSVNNLTGSYGKAIKDLLHLRSSISNFFTKQEENEEEKPEEKIPELQVKLLDEMAKQLLKDLQNSYESFLAYNKIYEQIQLSEKKTIELLVTLFSAPRQKCQKLKADLEERIKNMFKAYQNNMEFVFRIKQDITRRDYVDILCYSDRLKKTYPTISEEDSQLIREAIKFWILITLEIQSINRTIEILKESHVDKTALFRELESPREEISKKLYWICFEAEMKIRIWKSQQDTEEHLRNRGNGSVSQLNMGEGKTQVINPMIVLYNLFEPGEGQPLLSRINILSSLFQESLGNYFRFFSATSFRIPCFRLLVSRQIEVTALTINSIKQALHFFRQKVIILQDRESCLSMILKEREELLNKNQLIPALGTTRDEWLFFNLPLFDIFDEVDALMTPKKFYIYSIEKSAPLQGDRLRYEIGRIVFEIVCKELFQWLHKEGYLIADQPVEKCLLLIKKGIYPKGMRLQNHLSSEDRLAMRHKIAVCFLAKEDLRTEQFTFYKDLDAKDKQYLLNYLINQKIGDFEKIRNKLPVDLDSIYCLRGLLAFGILEHCLSMRPGVDFGVPGREHLKRVGVPYEAADVPSKRSQFAHPDLAILVSYAAYFSKGLTFQQFTEVIKYLLSLPMSAQNYYYNMMVNTIQDERFRSKDVLETRQINLDSPQKMNELYSVFQFCRGTIALWLINCVFPKDTKQYEKSISSSCWDMAAVEKSLGYSGTKDSRFLLPLKLTWQPSPNDVINGTDGKMIHLLIKHTLAIEPIKDGRDSLWMRLCQQALELIPKGVSCIIDAGAILVGKSLQKQIVPWICEHDLFEGSSIFKGITFCDQTGKWKVYDTTSMSIVERGTHIPEDSTFVIFDEARTRGADIRLQENARAVLTLSPNMTKDKLMQAVGRLRKFGRRQEVFILAPHEILSHMEQIKGKEGSQRIQGLIVWTCENSLSENRSLLLTNSKLALTHYETVLTGKPRIQIFKTDLETMYSVAVTSQSICKLHGQIVAKHSAQVKESDQVQDLTQNIQKYGKEQKCKGYNLQDACERQAQNQVQIQLEHKKDIRGLQPIPETDIDFEVYKEPISTLAYEFDDSLKFTVNFYQCTTQKRQFSSTKTAQQTNQLCKVNYVLITPTMIKVVSQMEANRLLHQDNQISNYGPQSISLPLDLDQHSILCRFKDVKHSLPLVEQYNFSTALTHAQFFNGGQVVQDKEGLLKYFVKMKKDMKEVNMKKKGVGMGRDDFYELVSHFLRRRNTINSKFLNSDLQKSLISLINLPTKVWQQP